MEAAGYDVTQMQGLKDVLVCGLQHDPDKVGRLLVFSRPSNAGLSPHCMQPGMASVPTGLYCTCGLRFHRTAHAIQGPCVNQCCK